MYAIISDGGSQLKVEEGQTFDIDFRDVKVGQQIVFDRVLAYRDDKSLRVGQPVLEGAKVTAEVVQTMVQGSKVVIQKIKRRKNFRRKTGHRQIYTRVKITSLSAG